MSRRLDQVMVERGLAESRTRAQDLIKAGQVLIRDQKGETEIRRPSHEVESGTEILVREGDISRFVSRGGLKLEGALARAGIVPEGWTVLDVGQSTGGFTDCLLRKGAVRVVGVDVGRDQLHPRLRADTRVRFFEGLHVKNLAEEPAFRAEFGPAGPDLIVIDVSFISLTAVLPALARIAGEGKPLLALVKPQFEVGPEALGKGGIVRDPLLYEAVERKIRQAAVPGWKVLSYFESPIEGKDGNKEFFLYALKI